MRKKAINPATREAILAAATDWFFTRGLAATGVEDICRRAGLSKGALFHYFRNKQELAIAVLERWVQDTGHAFAGAPFLQAADPVARVLGYVDFVTQLSLGAPPGCLIGILAQESAHTEPQLRAACEAAFERWRVTFAGFLKAAQKAQRTVPDFDADGLAAHFIAVFEGAQLLARARGDAGVIASELAHYRRYLERQFIPAAPAG